MLIEKKTKNRKKMYSSKVKAVDGSERSKGWVSLYIESILTRPDSFSLLILSIISVPSRSQTPNNVSRRSLSNLQQKDVYFN